MPLASTERVAKLDALAYEHLGIFLGLAGLVVLGTENRDQILERMVRTKVRYDCKMAELLKSS